MVNREDQIKEISMSIAHHAPPDNAVVHKWMSENGHKMDGSSAPVADYKLSLTTKKFGNMADKIKATTLEVLCKHKDNLYLKPTMAAAWVWQDEHRGVLVPARTKLITSPVMLKQLL
eukprot:13695457-Ditylum_brightwellii.AAC.1